MWIIFLFKKRLVIMATYENKTNAYMVCLPETDSAPGKDISSKEAFPFSCFAS